MLVRYLSKCGSCPRHAWSGAIQKRDGLFNLSSCYIISERIEVMRNDVISRGTFIIEGYSSARPIAQAMTAARDDECRNGFSKPFRMRPIKRSPGSPAVLVKWPSLHPLYSWLDVDGARFQNCRGKWNRTRLISDDARIEIEQRPRFDGHPVVDCGAQTRTVEAIQRLAQRECKVTLAWWRFSGSGFEKKAAIRLSLNLAQCKIL